MPAERHAGPDPGLFGEEPTAEELDQEEEARGEMTVAELVERDLDDPDTPSRRNAEGAPAPGSFDVPLEDVSGEPIDGR